MVQAQVIESGKGGVFADNLKKRIIKIILMNQKREYDRALLNSIPS